MEYKTEQKNTVLNFLKNNCENHFTVEQVVQNLKTLDGCPGKSTIYRIINNLVESGTVRRFQSNSEKKFVYQYAHLSDNCQHHYHLKCTDCGKLIHMECEHLNDVCRHIKAEHGFVIATGNSVIYGCCSKCSKGK